MENYSAAPQEPNPEPSNSKLIRASPTKDFFISMLVRDLTLRDAIGDLVDNSVDSAKVVMSGENYVKGEPIESIKIEINLSKDEFIIRDNCSGISVETASNYAFRIGRPANFDGLKGSIGQFGIGMKRALFKIGRDIRVNSVSVDSRFSLALNVDEWALDPDTWDFKFESYSENETNNISETGTTIIVRNLKEDVITDFEDNNFIKKLIAELGREHLYPLNRGLEIIVNGVQIEGRNLLLLTSEEIKPAYYEETFEDSSKVRIWAGIGDKSLEHGGWYIFGNSRLILGPEQTEISGWTGGRGADGVAKYHGQYDRFRGYVFFEADNASLLPWNTSKNGIDIDSPKYKHIKQQMIALMRPVINFLNQMKGERSGSQTEESRYLQHRVDQARPITIVDTPVDNQVNAPFVYPASPPKRNNGQVTIKYSRPKEQVETLKNLLKVTALKEIGEITFDYYFETEVE